MKIFLGSDHRGFELKNEVAKFLSALSIEIIDCGPQDFDAEDDFPDFAKAVAKSVLANSDSFGILACGSAQGVAMQANRFKGIRAAICREAEEVRETRSHNDANILCLAADNAPDFPALIQAFMSTPALTDEKYQRRINKLDEE
jgi:ribose 5-phosphate isomerase B